MSRQNGPASLPECPGRSVPEVLASENGLTLSLPWRGYRIRIGEGPSTDIAARATGRSPRPTGPRSDWRRDAGFRGDRGFLSRLSKLVDLVDRRPGAVDEALDRRIVAGDHVGQEHRGEDHAVRDRVARAVDEPRHE